MLNNIESALTDKNEKRIWFHCSSLGEFEQGKPLLTAVKNNYPDKKIVLTFFSPSGYEQQKHNPLADYVFYLPLDGPFNSKKFIELVNPFAVFFVKYEFWHFYVYYLKKKKIPCYYFSCVFRPSQIYFMFYGRFFKNILQRITHIFVQDQSSLALLYNHSIPHVTVSGDTRFDTVYENFLQRKNFPEIEHFIKNNKVLVAGSTWAEDEKVLSQLINVTQGYKWIIVPHEINYSKMEHFSSMLSKKTIRYSQITKTTIIDAEVLIIDSIGMLSSLYQYATITYIGGGFGAGIHNTLEAAVFGSPIIFGPRYHKFREATELVHLNCAFPVSNFVQLKNSFEDLNNNPEKVSNINSKSNAYVESKKGATAVIMNYVHLNW